MRPFLNWKRRTEPAASQASEPAVRSLLISCHEDYRAAWRRIFETRQWSLECASTLEEALAMLRVHPVPVVVYDSQAADEDWREVLMALHRLPERPCILLASSVIDEGLRDEVVGLHGYDVLSRQADEDEVARTINSAWFWKHRHA